MSTLDDRLAALAAERAKLEAAAEAAIAALDAFDGDADLEPGAALTDVHSFPGRLYVSDDREGDDEREADAADDEPSLGSRGGTAPGCGNPQSWWSLTVEDDASTPDREDEHDGREPDDDPGEDDGCSEPSLGSLGDMDQRRWNACDDPKMQIHYAQEREEQCEGEGDCDEREREAFV